MTTLTTPVAVSLTGRSRRAGVIWAAWRQHRAGLGCLLVALAAYAVLLRTMGANGKVGLASWALRGLLGVPALIGLLLGAPLIAREFETETYRFARTQGVSMARQVAATMLLLGAIIVAACTALGLVAAWWSRPHALIEGASHWQAQSFNRSVMMLPAWALLAFCAGVLAGAAIRRAAPAMAATLAGCVAAAFAVNQLTRSLLTVAPVPTRSAPSVGISGNFTGVSQHGLPRLAGVPMRDRQLTKAPAFPSGWPGPHGSWQVSGWLTGAHGQRLRAQAVAGLMRRLPARVALSEPRLRAWLAARHIGYWIGYQPAGRYWLLQGAAASIVIILAVAAGLAAIRLAGRRT